jgi:von Willebrand factor A domain-containing protein 8
MVAPTVPAAHPSWLRACACAAGNCDSRHLQVAADIAQLRSVLASAQLSSFERVWLRGQMEGDLDDGRLVHALTGDQRVMKRGGSPPTPPAGIQSTRPRHLAFAFDVSASMYRFDGTDGRLARSQAVAALLMEAFQGSGDRYRYAMLGHSGDGPAIPLTSFATPPATPADKLRVIDSLSAHAQFCSSGDHTVEAIVAAAQLVAKEAAAHGGGGDGSGDAGSVEGDRMVFVVSDANLSRYGIRPSHVAAAMGAVPGVSTYLAFLSPGLGDSEAAAFVAALPPRRAFLITSPAQLPAVFRGLLTAQFAAAF